MSELERPIPNMDVPQLSAADIAQQNIDAADNVSWFRRPLGTAENVVLVGTGSLSLMMANIMTQEDVPPLFSLIGGGVAGTCGMYMAMDRWGKRQAARYEEAKPESIDHIMPIGVSEVHRVLERSPADETNLHLIWTPPRIKQDPECEMRLLPIDTVAPALVTAAKEVGVNTVAIPLKGDTILDGEMPEGTKFVTLKDYANTYLSYTGKDDKKTKPTYELKDADSTVDRVAVIPIDSLDVGLDTERHDELMAVIDWLRETNPRHSLVKAYDQAGSLEAAYPALKKQATRLIENRLERVIPTVHYEDGAPVRGRQYRHAKISAKDGALQARWMTHEGRFDGSESLHEALETTEYEQERLRITTAGEGSNKAQHAFELRALELTYLYERDHEYNVNALYDLVDSTEKRDPERMLDTMVKHRTSSVLTPNTGFLEGRTKFDAFKKGLLFSGISGLAVFGIAARANTYASYADEMREEHPGATAEQIDALVDEHFHVDPLYIVTDVTNSLHERYLSGLTSEQAVSAEEADDTLIEETRQAVSELGSQVGNVGELDPNKSLLEVSGTLDSGGYWATGRAEQIRIRPGENGGSGSLQWIDEKATEESGSDRVEELPGSILDGETDHLSVYGNIAEIFDAQSTFTDTQGNTYATLAVPVREGTEITSAYLGDYDGQLSKYYDSESGEQLLLVPSGVDLNNRFNYRLAETERAAEFPLRATGSVHDDHRNPIVRSHNDYRAESLASWAEYAPEVFSSVDPADATNAMVDVIKSGEYLLNPIREGDIKDDPPLDLIAATLRNNASVCNTANTTLALSSPTLLEPVLGFDNGDGSEAGDDSGLFVVSQNESHMWTVDEQGEFFDATPGSGAGTSDPNFIEDTSIPDEGDAIPIGQITSALLGAGAFLARKPIAKVANKVERRYYRSKVSKFSDEQVEEAYVLANHALYAPEGSTIPDYREMTVDRETEELLVGASEASGFPEFSYESPFEDETTPEETRRSETAQQQREFLSQINPYELDIPREQRSIINALGIANREL